ncbi:MAG: hypothetical protein NZM38_07185 [Cytophagales bacterium]|nr:hypothetical protein [Cytophagales bacterium]MDW8384540.1 hypothetical protein [Flammeovirgaceae bacterium]
MNRSFYPDSVFVYAYLALQEAQRIRYKQGVAGAYHILSVGYRYQNPIDSAIFSIQQARLYYQQDSCLKAEFWALRLLSEYYLIKSDYAEAFSTYIESLRLSEQHHDLYEQASALLRIAKLLSHQDILENVAQQVQKAIKVFTQIDSLKDALQAYLFMLQHCIQKDTLSLNFWINETKNFFTSYKSEFTIGKQAEYYITFAQIFQKIGQSDSAQFYYSQAEKLLDTLQPSTDYSIYALLESASFLSFSLMQEKKSFEYLYKRLKIALFLGERNQIAISYKLLGNAYAKKRQDKQALFYYDSALFIFLNLKNSEESYNVYHAIGQIYESQENYPKACFYYEKSVNHALKTTNKYRIRKAYRTYHRCLYKAKQYEKAYLIAVELERIREEMFDNNQTAQTKIRAIQLELEKKENALALFQKETQIKELKANERFQWISTVLGILLLVSIFGGVIFYHYKKLKAAYEILESKQKEILSQNEELQIQHEQISAQKLEIEQKNQKIGSQFRHLKKAQRIIRRQHRRLQEYNANLEKIVELRTEQLTKLNHKLGEYANRITNFSFLTAHNLRAPIARILGLSYLFHKEKENASQVQQIIQSINKEAYNADSVLHNMMTVLNMKELSIQLENLKSIKLSDALQEAILKSKVSEISIHPSLYFQVLADFEILVDIFRTLLQYSATFRMDMNLADVVIEASYLPNHGKVVLSYKDARIQFYSASSQNQIDGLELPLYITKIQVEALQGNVEFNTKEDSFCALLSFRAPLT